MARQPLATWQDILAHEAARERELELATADGQTEFENPFWQKSEIEKDMAEYMQRLIRETPKAEYDTLGSACWLAVDASNGYAIPQSVVRVVSVKLQFTGGDTTYYPATYLAPASAYHFLNASAKQTITNWTIVAGQLRLPSGVASARVLFLIEPTIDDFRANAPTVPIAAVAERIVDMVHKRQQVIDFMPGGRV